MRTFIAIELSSEIKEALGEVRALLQRRMPDRAVRWVRPAKVHLTLKFLGEVTPGGTEGVEAMLIEATRRIEPFVLSVNGVGCFPNFRQPRVVWAGIEGDRDSLNRLQRVVEVGAASLGYERERRAFSPHLTLGRIHRRAPRGDARKVGEAVQQAEVGMLGEWRISEVAFIKSDLRPEGAVYTPLGRYLLGD